MEPKSGKYHSVIAADKLAAAVIKLIKNGVLDARSDVGDKVLDYASARFGDQNPIGDLEVTVRHYDNNSPPQHR